MANKKPFYREFRRTLYETVSDSGNSVLRYRGHDNKEHYVASSEDPDVGPSGGGMTEVTWQELKDKRDVGELTPGSLYRITDYNCTTTQEDTQSAGHQFDIVLLALSEDKLAEEGWAMMHDNIYDVTFADDVTLKCYIYNFEGNDIYLVDVNTLLGYESKMNIFDKINEESKTAHCDELYSIALTDENLPYNYFQNSNLSAWKVWYCLDNDTARFAWADEENGKGVVYRLIDEWNNDCPYDFKNIQFVRKLTDGEYDPNNGENTWVYTFNLWYESYCVDCSIVGNTLTDDVGDHIGVKNNILNGLGTHGNDMADNVFLSGLDETIFYGIVNNRIGGVATFSNTILGFGVGIDSNTLLNVQQITTSGDTKFFMYCAGGTYEGDAACYILDKKVLTES